MQNHWPKLVILDTIGIAIGDTDKITNIINDTIKRNGIITEKWVIRKLIGKQQRIGKSLQNLWLMLILLNLASRELLFHLEFQGTQQRFRTDHHWLKHPPTQYLHYLVKLKCHL